MHILGFPSSVFFMQYSKLCIKYLDGNIANVFGIIRKIAGRWVWSGLELRLKRIGAPVQDLRRPWTKIYHCLKTFDCSNTQCVLNKEACWRYPRVSLSSLLSFQQLQRYPLLREVGSTEHCVGTTSIRTTVHAWSSLLMSWWFESGVKPETHCTILAIL